MRDVVALVTTPYHLIQSRLPKLREVWAAATTARLRAEETRSFSALIRDETIAANLGPEAIERTEFLYGYLFHLVGLISLAQFIVHTTVKSWVAEGALGAEGWVECVRQTRRSIRFVAHAFQNFIRIPRGRSVAISQTFLQIEAAPDWVELALERLSEEDEADEVTTDELGSLVCGMRLAGWSSARAGIRLRELEQGVVALKQAAFERQMEYREEDYLSQYLNLSEL